MKQSSAKITLDCRTLAGGELVGALRPQLENEILPRYLAKRRWFAGKDVLTPSVRIDRSIAMPGESGLVLLILEVSGERGTEDLYFLPVGIAPDRQDLSLEVISEIDGAEVNFLVDVLENDDLFRSFLFLLGEEAEKPDRQLDGLVFTGAKDLLLEGARADLQLNKAEQSNSSIRFAKVMMKVYRKLQRGVHPEVEVGCFLTDVAKFKNTPRLLGTLEYRQSGEETITLSVCQELISDARDGWSHALVLLSDAGDFESPSGKRRSLVELCTRLGQRTAELHRAFAVDTDNPSFAAEPMTDKDAVDWSKRLIQEASGILDRLAASQQTEATARLLGKRSEVMGWLSAVAQMKISACKTRLHGDYHLGQVLVSDGDVYIIDFEGEPMRSLQERRRKQLPLRDVAGMLRSFDYLLEASRRGDNNAATDGLLTEMRSAFLMTYQNKIAGCSSFPNDMRQANELLLVYLLEKSIYEIGYELSNRPDWIDIPVRSLLAIIEQPMSMFE